MVLRTTFGDRRVPRWRPSWRICNAPLVYLDLETTGLYPEKGHRITEIGLIDGGGTRLHRDLEDSDDDAEIKALNQLANELADLVVVGHNILFDLQFMAERGHRLGVKLPQVGVVDTLGLARHFLDIDDEDTDQDGPIDLTLAQVADDLDIDIPQELHRALPDARLCRSVLDALIERFQLQTLRDIHIRRLRLQYTPGGGPR